MPICERFEITIVPFPFVDRAPYKLRPALCLSSGDFMRANGHGLFAMVTSARFSHWPSDVPLRTWQAAGLSAPSILRWKIFTLPETLIERIAGRLAEPDRSVVAEAFALFGA